jgi:hypothetical protein
VETARIIGHVRDQSGAVIPNATVTITNSATNIGYVARTQADGSYESIPLRVGSYRVTAEQTGFKRYVRAGIVLQIEQTALIDIVMEVGQVTQDVQVTAATPLLTVNEATQGQVTQDVEVTGAAPLLTVNEATQGQVIDNRKVVDLPLNGRDYAQLGLLSSGTDQAAPGARTGGFSASGMRSTQNNYLLDGVDNNNVQIAYQDLQGKAVKPNVDAIQEFKVMKSAFSAEYGRATGAIINVTMKSGTNDLHGTAFQFLRNEKLDARNYFDLPGQAEPPLKRNQFGFSAGRADYPQQDLLLRRLRRGAPARIEDAEQHAADAGHGERRFFAVAAGRPDLRSGHI